MLLPFIDRLAQMVSLLSRYMMYLGIVVLIVITVFTIYGVTLRALGRPVGWPLEVSELLQTVLALLPSAYVLNKGKHVNLGFVENIFSGLILKIIQSATYILASIICFLVAYTTYFVAESSYFMREATVVVSFPIYPFKFCVFFGFVLLGLQSLACFWTTIRRTDLSA